MAKLKIKNKEIAKFVLGENPPEFPKYTTQIMNLANRNAQGTRPKVVGQMSDLIQQFDGQDLKEWEEWYLARYPKAIETATGKVFPMIEKFRGAILKIDKSMVREWLKDLIITKTFTGLRFQEAILDKLAKQLGVSYRLATASEESKGIDGYVGEKPVSIKPATYKSKDDLYQDKITVSIIYYDKKKDGIVIEYDL